MHWRKIHQETLQTYVTYISCLKCRKGKEPRKGNELWFLILTSWGSSSWSWWKATKDNDEHEKQNTPFLPHSPNFFLLKRIKKTITAPERRWPRKKDSISLHSSRNPYQIMKKKRNPSPFHALVGEKSERKKIGTKKGPWITTGLQCSAVISDGLRKKGKESGKRESDSKKESFLCVPSAGVSIGDKHQHPLPVTMFTDFVGPPKICREIERS